MRRSEHEAEGEILGIRGVLVHAISDDARTVRPHGANGRAA
jgi:hypothetical protein